MLELPDQITFFMAFLMLCFAGLLVMFYFVLRAVDELSKTIRVERSALVSGLRDVESAMQRLEQVLSASVNTRSFAGAETPAPSVETPRAPKKEERLNFSPESFSEMTGERVADPSADLLSMSPDQQKAAKANGKVLRLDGIEPLLLK